MSKQASHSAQVANIFHFECSRMHWHIYYNEKKAYKKHTQKLHIAVIELLSRNTTKDFCSTKNSLYPSSNEVLILLVYHFYQFKHI